MTSPPKTQTITFHRYHLVSFKRGIVLGSADLYDTAVNHFNRAEYMLNFNMKWLTQSELQQALDRRVIIFNEVPL